MNILLRNQSVKKGKVYPDNNFETISEDWPSF
jgi:hypothetical protein